MRRKSGWENKSGEQIVVILREAKDLLSRALRGRQLFR
jgi:hypothetical protein